jgi:hypothetical protein
MSAMRFAMITAAEKISGDTNERSRTRG